MSNFQPARSTSRPSTVRPTTPIRRVSRGSLAALSASRAREEDEAGLFHLEPIFIELADAMQDFRSNCETLDEINRDLDDFNEAFSSFLFGLKMNAYTAEFVEAPTEVNFRLAAQRAASEAARRGQVQAEVAEPTPQVNEAQDQHDMTFETNPGDASMVKRAGRPVAGLVRGRGRGTKSIQQRKKDRLIEFSKTIIETLPIKYREEQPHRQEMEQIISVLRQHAGGLYSDSSLRSIYCTCLTLSEAVPDIVKATSPPVPSHRVNEACLTLVRSKHALKLAQKGLLFKLDPMRHPPAPL